MMYAKALIFLRFGCYVHNPDSVYTKASQPIVNWLDEIQKEDHEWGYKVLAHKTTRQSVISLGVPSTLHHALCDFDADYTYTELSVVQVKSILTARRNTIRLTRKNLETFMRISKTTKPQLVDVLESYLARIEMNPMQPVTDEELHAIKRLGVSWSHAARLPRMDDFDFEPIYIVDEHHRIKCL